MNNKNKEMNKKQIKKIKYWFWFISLIVFLWFPFKSNTDKINFVLSILSITIFLFTIATVWFIKNEEYKKFDEVERYNLKLGAIIYGIIGLVFLSLWLLGIGVDLKIRFIEAIMIGAALLGLFGKKGSS
ncbi:MAG: hypothetical protein D4R94_04505 [Chitinophagaceae bacterium]|nr:MAG: hypothetical protein D4R94_04505 [Chitinophagaceae bacterium]